MVWSSCCRMGRWAEVLKAEPKQGQEQRLSFRIIERLAGMIQHMSKQRGNFFGHMKGKEDDQVLGKLLDKVQLQLRAGVRHRDFHTVHASRESTEV